MQTDLRNQHVTRTNIFTYSFYSFEDIVPHIFRLGDSHALVCNYEVLQLTKETYETAKKRKDVSRSQEMLRTITYEVTEYLSKTSCASLSSQNINHFLEVMKTSRLTKGEKLQILNICPRHDVGLNLIVEHCPQRFSDEQQTNLTQTIVQTLDLPVDSDDDDDDDDRNGDSHEMTKTDVANLSSDLKSGEDDDEDADSLAMRMFQQQIQAKMGSTENKSHGNFVSDLQNEDAIVADETGKDDIDDHENEEREDENDHTIQFEDDLGSYQTLNEDDGLD
eukprot:gene6459-9337_t